VLLFSLWGIWLLWRRRVESAKWFQRVAIWAAPVPFIMNTAGWLLTENGRQPWIVQGLQLTRNGVSPSVSTTSVVISLSVFILLYGVLAVVDWALMLRYSRRQLDPIPEAPDERRAAVAATHY
jgi:cytochrome d ubiquinol oxidase subunit I